jgi:hypothetical protein
MTFFSVLIINKRSMLYHRSLLVLHCPVEGQALREFKIMNKKEVRAEKETLAQYSLYMEKREELQCFLNREVIIWGAIPISPIT